MLNFNEMLAKVERFARSLPWYPFQGKIRLDYRVGRLRRLLIGPHGVAVLTDTANGKLLVPAGDFMLGRSLAFNGAYCPEDLALLCSRIGPESEVLVVGAHVGALLVPLAHRAKAAVGIEANPATFEFLALNLRLNGLERKVEIFNYAAGDRADTVEFMTNLHNSGQSKIKTAATASVREFTYDSPGTVRVPMRPLDDALSGRHFDLVVMDLEGSEVTAMRGMSRILADTKYLMLEIQPVYYSSAEEAIHTLLPFLAQRFSVAVTLGHKSSELSVYALSELEAAISEMWRRRIFDVLFESEKPSSSKEFDESLSQRNERITGY